MKYYTLRRSAFAADEKQIMHTDSPSNFKWLLSNYY